MSANKEICDAVQNALTLAEALAREGDPGKAVVLLEFDNIDDFMRSRREILRSIRWEDFTDGGSSMEMEKRIDRDTVEYQVFGGVVRLHCRQPHMHSIRGRQGGADFSPRF